MGRRKPRKSYNKEIETISENFDDFATFDNSDDDDPLALLTTANKSTKDKKIANKKAAKRKNQGKKKPASKKAKSNGVDDISSASADEDSNYEAADHENTSKKGSAEDEDTNEEVVDYEIANKKVAKRKNQGKKKPASKKAKSNGVADISSADDAAGDEDQTDEVDDRENTSQKGSAEDEEVADYEVEKIIDVQYMKSGAREFLIRWKGFGPEGDTWEPEDNLSCPDIITKFLDKKTSPKKPANKGNNKKKKEIKKKQLVEQEDSTTEYEVEKIIEVHHRRDGGKEFLIRWKGCQSEQDSWEPEENLFCPELIEKFMAKVEKLSHFEKREVRTAPKHTDRFTLTMKSTGRRISKRNGDKQRTTYFDAE